MMNTYTALVNSAITLRDNYGCLHVQTTKLLEYSLIAARIGMRVVLHWSYQVSVKDKCFPFLFLLMAGTGPR